MAQSAKTLKQGKQPAASADLDSRRAGWKWRVLLSLSGFYAFYYLGRVNWGILAPYMRKPLGLTTTQIGLGATLMFAVYAVTAFFNGGLSDRFGRKLWCVLGGVGTTIFNWAASFGASFAGVAIPYALNGAAQSMAYGPGNGLLAQWWPRRERGFASGFFLTAADLSGILAWAITFGVVATLGWQAAFRLPFLLTLAGSAMLYFVARDYPREVGLIDLPDEQALAAAGGPPNAPLATSYRQLFGNWRFVLTCLTGFLGYIGRYGLYTWIPLYWVDTSGLHINAAVISTIVLPTGMLLGPVAMGWASDHIFQSRRWPGIALSMALGAVCLLAMAFLPIRTIGLGPSLALLLVSGFFVMAGLGLVYARGMDAAGLRSAGAAAGVIDGSNYTGAAVQGILIGSLLSMLHNNWTVTFVVIACCLLLGALLIVIARDDARPAIVG